MCDHSNAYYFGAYQIPFNIILIRLYIVMVFGLVFSLLRIYAIPAMLGLVWWFFILAFIVYVLTYNKYGKLSAVDSSYMDAYREIQAISSNVFIVMGMHLLMTVLLCQYDFFTYAIKLGTLSCMGIVPLLYYKYGVGVE